VASGNHHSRPQIVTQERRNITRDWKDKKLQEIRVESKDAQGQKEAEDFDRQNGVHYAAVEEIAH
jgi:hypothetical protein